MSDPHETCPGREQALFGGEIDSYLEQRGLALVATYKSHYADTSDVGEFEATQAAFEPLENMSMLPGPRITELCVTILDISFQRSGVTIRDSYAEDIAEIADRPPEDLASVLEVLSTYEGVHGLLPYALTRFLLTDPEFLVEVAADVDSDSVDDLRFDLLTRQGLMNFVSRAEPSEAEA